MSSNVNAYFGGIGLLFKKRKMRLCFFRPGNNSRRPLKKNVVIHTAFYYVSMEYYPTKRGKGSREHRGETSSEGTDADTWYRHRRTGMKHNEGAISKDAKK
jgi:methylphosphotriester-DNA--protein-cysteine methyltransferase